MLTALYAAALLVVAIGFAHSYLGERYILIRLFRRKDLPQIFGSADFTKQTLRFAWHVTTIAWLGFAALLILTANQSLSARSVGLVVGATFSLHFAIALLGSRGRHYSWIVFLAIAVLTLWSTQA